MTQPPTAQGAFDELGRALRDLWEATGVIEWLRGIVVWVSRQLARIRRTA